MTTDNKYGIDLDLIKKLPIGYTFKNYRHLCETLKVESRTGGAKVNFLEELSRYVKFEDRKANSHAFIIKEIYDNPLSNNKIDRRIYGKLSKYDFTNILYYFFPFYENCIDNPKGYSTIELAEILGFLNYSCLFNTNSSLIQSETGTSIPEIVYFRTQIKSKIYNLIPRRLHNLNNQRIINLQEKIQFICTDTNGENEYTEYPDNLAYENFKNILKEILDEYCSLYDNCKSINDIYKMNLDSIFYSHVYKRFNLQFNTNLVRHKKLFYISFIITSDNIINKLLLKNFPNINSFSKIDEITSQSIVANYDIDEIASYDDLESDKEANNELTIDQIEYSNDQIDDDFLEQIINSYINSDSFFDAISQENEKKDAINDHFNFIRRKNNNAFIESYLINSSASKESYNNFLNRNDGTNLTYDDFLNNQDKLAHYLLTINDIDIYDIYTQNRIS